MISKSARFWSSGKRPRRAIWRAATAAPKPGPNSTPARSYTEGCGLIGQVEALGMPRPMFILTGGDPFKRSDIFDLVSYASGLGLTRRRLTFWHAALELRKSGPAEGDRNQSHLVERGCVQCRDARSIPPRTRLVRLDHQRLEGGTRDRAEAADQHHCHPLQPARLCRRCSSWCAIWAR